MLQKALPFLTMSVTALAAASAGAAEVKYMLWDSNQLPAYQQCAVDFQKANPGTTIKITQAGWDDYWTAISTGFISGTAPDVFTNHLAKYPEFAKNNQLVDLAPLIARDKVKTDIYANGLFDTWGRSGKQFGLPKDWDTIILSSELFKYAKANYLEVLTAQKDAISAKLELVEIKKQQYNSITNLYKSLGGGWQ